MKISEFKRDVENNIWIITEDGNEVKLDFAYVAEHQPQIGDDYPTLESITLEPVTPKPVAIAA